MLATTITLSPGIASATLNRALSFTEKMEISKVIIHAAVERVESEWEIPGTRISTAITVRVLASLKGGLKVGQRIQIRQPGGQIGDLLQVAQGMSTFTPGEEAVLFLEPYGAELMEIGVGIAKYNVALDRGDKQVTHHPDVGEVRIEPSGEMTIAEAQPMEPVPLAVFLERIQAYVERRPIHGQLPIAELPMLRIYP